MINYIKSTIRNLFPARYQVPVKYLYNWLLNDLEKEMSFLKMIVKKQDRVIDIGGNRGVYAYRFWKLGANVEVFEPNPLCAIVLSVWAADKINVQVHSVALSSTSSSAYLHIPVDDSGIEHDASASIENNTFTHARDQLVDLRTLDSYNFQNVSMIKIDVEGHESSVIDGAEKTLRSSCPALLIEIEQRHSSNPISEMFDRIQSFGYHGYFLMNGNLTTLDDFDVGKDQSVENLGSQQSNYINNFLFLHQSRLNVGEYKPLIKS